jgi:ABC-type phosphate/phosphonate transport system substrate-binding protein
MQRAALLRASRSIFSARRFASTFPLIDASVGGAAHLERRRAAPRAASRALLLGTVCYSESTASIWKGIMRHFARRGLDVETVLFSSYERMNAQLLAGQIHIAWNGPLAHARVLRLAGAHAVLALGMRDSDRDFGVRCVVRADAGVADAPQLAGRRVAFGTVDSPQAYLAPLAHLQRRGVPLHTLTALRFDRDVGKHGDTAHGETAVLQALRSGAAEAGFVSELMWQRALAEPGATEGLSLCDAAAPPPFDHCQFTALRARLSARRAAAFQEALFAMDGSGHPEDAQTLALEGVRRGWLPPRGGAISAAASDPRAGYEAMLAALEGWGEPKTRWPGQLHTPQRHPFKHLLVDSALVRDSFGC